MFRSMLLSVLLAFAGGVYAQSLIPFEFTSEEDNRFIKENDSFKYYVASGDTMNTVCINEETSFYKLLNKERKVIAEGGFIMEADKYLQDGKWIERFDNGKIKRTGYYQRNIPVGAWQEYYSNGKIKAISNYGIFIQDNETLSALSGTYQEYYTNGKLKVNGFYGASITTVHDTIAVTDPIVGRELHTIVLHKTLVANRIGHWEYYDENGDLEKKEDLNY